MEQHYFIGAVEIILLFDCDVSGQEFNFLFMNPVLPVKNRHYVLVETCDHLPVPKEMYGESVRISWSEDGMHYTAFWQQGGWLSVCCIQEDGNEKIFVDENRMNLFLATFRPWTQLHLERVFIKNNAMILHSAGIEYLGEAILFAAPSGTGKSTQTDLWRRYVDGVTDLNGDRILLQKTDDGWFACGFPICGNSGRCMQKALPLRAVVLIRQNVTDRVTALSDFQKFSLILNGLAVPLSDQECTKAAMNLLEDLIKKVCVIRLDCSMDITAVKTLYSYLYGDHDIPETEKGAD